MPIYIVTVQPDTHKLAEYTQPVQTLHRFAKQRTGSVAMRVTDHANYQNQKYLNSPNKSGQPEIRQQDSCEQYRRTEDSTQKNSAEKIQKRPTQQKSAAKRAFERRSSSSLYSSTSDLMAIANTEDQELLRGIYVRLSFKIWSVRAAGATGTDSNAIKSATRSIEKVMGKVKAKIKGLKKEGELEKRAETARKAKQRRLQQELQRELAIKRKIRRNKEKRDVEESYLESDGQHSVKSYRDNLPLEVLIEMEMQRSGFAGTGIAESSMVDAAVEMTATDAAISVPINASTAVGGDIVDVAL